MASVSRRPTLADVARNAGTSTAVVSYVVNNGPRTVSPATRVRVERAIRELGYRRNPIAGALSAGRSNLVGLLVPDTSNGFFGELSRHIEGEGRRRGLMTLLGNTGYDPEVATEYASAFSDLLPRGILVTSVAGEATVADDTPRVFVHASPSAVSAPSVTFDDVGGAVAAVTHLLEHGFRDIHCLSGLHDGGPASRREQGWREVLESASIPTARRLHRTAFDRVEVEAAARAILERRRRPRAIFATTDEQALAVLRAASVVGLRVPQDLAIVGFDGIREAHLGSVRLTTVSLPLGRLASSAFDTLDTLSPTNPTPHVVLPGTLSIGETCGCPRDRVN